MENLEQLSDDELRLRLVQCGLPLLPVTSTTRKILIKKLRHFIENEKQKLHRDSSKATRYSSGEESDSSDGLRRTAAQRKSLAASSSSSSNTRVGRSQRATVAGALPSMAMPPPTAAASAALGRPSMKRIPNTSSISTSPVLSTHFGAANGGNAVNNHHHAGTAGSSTKASLSPTSSSSIYISPVIVHDSEEDDYPHPSSLRGGPPIRGFGNVSTPPQPTSHSSLFRKMASLAPNITPPSANSSMYSNINSSVAGGGSNNNNSGGAGALLNDSNGSSNGAANDSSSPSSTPYISEYTKRLMQLRGETVSQENYNSAISGIIGRRGSNSGGGIPAPFPISSRYGGPSQASGMLHHPGHLRFNKPNATAGGGGGGGSAGNSVPSSPLGTAGSIIAGNHIRQRYSRLQAGGIGGGGQYEFNENDIVTHAQPSPDPPSIPYRVRIGNMIKRLDDAYGFKQTFIPCALLCLLMAFLLFVAFMYMTISTDLASTLSSIDTRYDLCEKEGGIAGTTCVQSGDVEPALELLKLIGNELKARVEQHHCRDAATVSGLMSAGEALKYAKENSPSVLIPQLTRHLHAMEYLIDRNPQWRIDHCGSEGEPIAFAEVLDRRATRSNHFTILRPKLPFTCMMYNKFQKFFIVVGALAIAGIVALAANYLFRFVLQVKQKRREQVHGLISEIIHAVSQAAANASDAAAASGGKEQDARVVISHLRDRLLGPANRRKLGWAWDEALQFLEHNESRILFEVGSIGGEDFKMMRWIDSAPLATSVGGGSPSGGGRAGAAGAAALGGGGGGCAKKWQSPAFDNSNKIHDPPTPCLKIRQMFDKYEVNDPNLKTIVQDAILEKVGGRCKIYDIQLDRSSCCVYVRCATAKDAGIVHDEINGWWFDNRLVSIKFLRLERYTQRFPRSGAGPTCLKPSNKNNSSMSHQLSLNNANGSGNGRFGNDRHDPDTDPEDEEEDDADEEEEDEEEVEEELMAAATIGARSAHNPLMGRRSGSVVNGRRGVDEGQEN
ncbi:inner nuclear membrane protein Man1 [Anopheles ziemanni]|uniref:inner nuclear membrane protein Man1 n=1 Tax=Anopheles coustani TaxID=139045 RepID=UPI00265942CB|nr:inner nuclear membrane protein Man1 [Anopheles coustani]XP_058167608.1 inner nuclear membrane protein Man1 [Anopheles ziemanni]